MNKKLLFIAVAFSLLSFVQTTFAQGVGEEGFVGPGGCTTKEECRAYCDIDNNKEECLTFAVEKGMMTQEDADRARAFLSQTGPGGCRGDECRSYCDDPANTEECIRFAEEQGFIKPGEGERFRKLRELSQRGGPGGCKGEECHTYCEDESHRNECFAFARENGLLNEEQVKGYEIEVKIRQTIKEVGGPGGCKSERECHKYCSDSSRIDECAAFGAEHTGKSPEEMRRMLEKFNQEGFRTDGPGAPEGFDQRREEFERRLRDEAGLRERMMQEGYGAPEGFRSPEGFQGQTGCDSPESCREYCMNNPQACGYTPGPRENYQAPQESYPKPESFEQYRQYEQNYQTPEQFQQYQENYQTPEQYQTPTTTSEPTFTPPPSEFQTQPTSYDSSRSFLANIWSAFLAPFRQ